MDFDLDRPIDSIGLSVRSSNMLRHAGVLTAGQLVQLSEEDLQRVRNLGARQVVEIRTRLVELGYLDSGSVSQVREPPAGKEPFFTWGRPAVRLLAACMEEAMRLQHSILLPRHLLLATLQQSTVVGRLDAVGQRPELSKLRLAFSAELPPLPPLSGEIPVSGELRSAFAGVRPYREGIDEPDLLYPLTLTHLVEEHPACRALLVGAGADPEDYLRAFRDLQ